MTTNLVPVSGPRAVSPATTDALPSASSGGDAAALLPDPAGLGLCDGSISELAALLTRADEQDRTASRQIEDAADQAAMQAANDRVQQLRDKAGADERQGLAEGIGEIAGGASMIAGAFVTPAGTSSQSCPSSTKSDIDWSAVFNGGGRGLPGAGKTVGAVFKGDADRADAQAAELDAQAQADTRRYNEAHDDAQAASQSLQKVQQFLDQIQQTENATRLAAATVRA